MIGYLIKKGYNYICSNCRMIQPHVDFMCHFCQVEFSNFETILLEMYNDLTNPQISDIINVESEGKDIDGEL